VTIKYVELTAYGYNEATITRFPFGPVQAEFNEDVILVYPVSILYENIGIFSHTSEISIDLSKYQEIKHPEKTSFFIRTTPNQGVFTMLPTAYDSISNILIATITDFGEIVLGETDGIYTANTPILYEPLNNQQILILDSLALRWTGRGVYDLFQLQVFSDSLYSDSVIDTTMNLSFFILENLTNHSIYFWRVRSILGSEVSSWSPVWSFEVMAPSGIETDSDELPDEYGLFQNYPNPFNPSTIINYQLPESGFVSLKVFDILGNEVARLVDENKQSGIYEVVFNASNLPSGVYFYTLQASDYVSTKKMVLLK
jgi:hypothetical protein